MDIQITEEMIKAGAAELWNYWPGESDEEDLIRRILLAAHEAGWLVQSNSANARSSPRAS